MPLPKHWKIVGGTVTMAVALGSGIATAAQSDEAPERIELRDPLTLDDVQTTTTLPHVITEDTLAGVTTTTLPDVITEDTLAAVTTTTLADITDDTLASPFDDADATASPASVDSPPTPDSPDTPDSPESVDTPPTPDSPDSPDSPESVDSPASPDSADTP